MEPVSFPDNPEDDDDDDDEDDDDDGDDEKVMFSKRVFEHISKTYPIGKVFWCGTDGAAVMRGRVNGIVTRLNAQHKFL